MSTTTKKILTPPLMIAIAVIITASLFSLLHWPYGKAMLITGCAVIFVIYPFRFYAKKEKNAKDYLKLLFAFFWPLNAVFTVMHWPYRLGFQIIATVALISWLLLEAYSYMGFEKTKGEKNTFSSFLYSTIFTLIALGVIFKVLYYPYANLLLLIGIIFALFLVLKEFLLKK